MRLRSSHARVLRSRTSWCIVVEGQRVEKDYFESAKGAFNRSGGPVLTIKSCNGGSAGQILSAAIAEAQSFYDRVWCVLDADTFGDSKQDQLKLTQAKKFNVDVIFSNPCFEVWYLLHFKQSHGAFPDGSAVKTEARRLMKSPSNAYARDWDVLRAQLQQGTPFVNAMAAKAQHEIPPNVCHQCNSSTDVDLLMTVLGF